MLSCADHTRQPGDLVIWKRNDTNLDGLWSTWCGPTPAVVHHTGTFKATSLCLPYSFL